MIEAAGGRVLLSTRVCEVAVRHGHFERLVLGDGTDLRTTTAVLALPPQPLATLWPAADGDRPAWEGRFEPSPCISTMLWFDRPLRAGRFWAQVHAPDDFNLDFYDLGRIREGHAQAPSLIAANAIHATGNAHGVGWTDDAVIARTYAEVCNFAPAARHASVRHARVHRIPMTVPCPRPGTETRRPAAATPWQGLWIAADWTATGLPCSMESAARAGAIAAEAVAARLGRHVDRVRPLPETTGLVGLLRRRQVAPAVRG